MTTILLCALFASLGSYVTALAVSFGGGAATAQAVATAVGLASTVAALAVVGEYINKRDNR